jgi:hypothetical protein
MALYSAEGLTGVGDSSVRRLMQDAAVALAAGLVCGLIAALASAHVVLASCIGIAACIAGVFGLQFVSRRGRRALMAGLISHRWLVWRGHLLLTAKVQVRNRSKGDVQIDTSFTYTPSGRAETLQLSSDDELAFKELVESELYFPPLSGFRSVPARSPISGWHLALVPRDPAGGTPPCKIIIQDVIGNRYEICVEQQKPHTFA